MTELSLKNKQRRNRAGMTPSAQSEIRYAVLRGLPLLLKDQVCRSCKTTVAYCLYRDFVGLRAALKAQPGVALSPAWDALSKAQSVRHRNRYLRQHCHHAIQPLYTQAAVLHSAKPVRVAFGMARMEHIADCVPKSTTCSFNCATAAWCALQHKQLQMCRQL